jgi:outer membrane protein assembly factor BamB
VLSWRGRAGQHSPDVSTGGEPARLPPPSAAAGDWSCWRGARMDNRAPAAEAPLRWGEKDSVLWKQPVPGLGHSTPIFVADQIILTTAEESPQRQLVLALDRRTGKPRWQTVVHEGGFLPKHPSNSHASATPACDGSRIFVTFLNSDALWVTALDLAGAVLWQTRVGPHGASHGSGSSPVLYQDLVLVNGDCPAVGFVAAVHRQTGRVVWRKGRPSESGNHATPLVARLGGRDQMILTGGNAVTSYEPLTGAVLWTCPGPADCTANTPTAAPDLVVVSGGHPQRQLLAIRPDGAIAWSWDRRAEVPYVSSAVLHAGHLFVVSDDGQVSCFAAKTGRQTWRQRLSGSFWASPLVVGDRVYAVNRAGTTHVFGADPGRFQRLATNRLDGEFHASPVAVDGRLFLRSAGFLYCIGGG